MRDAALVFFGAGCGAVARWQLQMLVNQRWPEFPVGTWIINVLGSFLIGLIIARKPSEAVHLVACVGLLGGFTTFSAFSLETSRLIESGRLGPALGYAIGSVVACVAGCALGLKIGAIGA